MPAGANADPATNIVSTSADLNGTIAGADPGDQYQFSFGTTPGGPYPTFPILQPSPSPAADGPVTQNTGNQLSPNTTYYYVITTYDSLNNVIAVSNEQSFTTLSVSIESCNDVNCQCATCLIAGETSAVTCLVAYGNTNTNWYYVQRWGTTPGGPYPNTSVPPNTNFAQGTDPDGDVSYQPPGTFPSGTQIYYVWEMYDDNNVLQDTSPECTFNTVQPYSVACDPATNITQTSADLQGTLTDMPSSIAYQFIWGTTPGGPYPNTTGLLPGPGPGANPVFQNIAGLTPNTTYYYKVESRVGTNNVEKQSTECSFTTAAVVVPRTAQCDPASLITDTSATLNGTIGGIQPGDTYTFHYGTTPGGPYPLTVGPTAAANGPVSAPVAGLTPSTNYYFIVTVEDSGAVNQATSGECTFATAAAPPPVRTAQGDPATNITSSSADFNGTLGNVQPGDTYRFRYGPTGGPYGTTVGPFPAVNGPVTNNVPGLAPNTQYCYIVEVLDAGASVVATSASEVCFTTAAAPPVSFNPECNPATGVTTREAFVQGTVDNMDGLHKARIEVATAPGGPYTFLQSGDTFGNNTVDQPIPGVPFNIPGLSAGTTYYYRTAVYDNANVFVEASTECSFTTPNPSIVCGTVTNITNSTADFNATALEADSPPGLYFYLVQVATVSGGPYTSLPGATNNDGTDPDAFTASKTGLTAGTTYFYRYQIADNQGIVYTGPECGSFATTNTTVTPDPPSGQTSTCVTINAHSDDAPSGCNYSFAWGTTPGGPYPNIVPGVPAVSTGANPEPFSATICGLSPGQTIYFIPRVQCGLNPIITGPEGTAQTTSIIVDPCEPATNITPTSATIAASATGVPAGYGLRFRYGYTPGGPYTFTAPGTPAIATGADPIAWTANLAGLTAGATVYYISEVLNPAQQVVADGGECSFQLTQATGPDGFVYWCGALYDSGQCIFVPFNEGDYYGDSDGNAAGYYNCSFVDSIDDV